LRSNKNLNRGREEQKSRRNISQKNISEISTSVIGLPSPLLLNEPPNISQI
jgi:hypothetical protein